MAAIAVTEPDAGSDVAAIKTRAVRDGDDWVINGSKIYITNAATADWLCLLAVTDSDAGYGGYSQIVVPTDVPGFRYELLDKIGNWGSDTGQLYFEDVRVPVANTIGDVGRGFQQQMMQFQDERLVACVSSIAASRQLWEETTCVGRAARAVRKAAVQDAEYPVRDGGPVDPAHGRPGADPSVRPPARGGRRCNRGASPWPSSSAPASPRKVADECIQLHGGYGYMKESAAGRAFVDSRLVSIGGGSDETMLHYLAKQLGF